MIDSEIINRLMMKAGITIDEVKMYCLTHSCSCTQNRFSDKPKCEIDDIGCPAYEGLKRGIVK